MDQFSQDPFSAMSGDLEQSTHDRMIFHEVDLLHFLLIFGLGPETMENESGWSQES